MRPRAAFRSDLLGHVGSIRVVPGKYTDKYTYVIPLLRVLARRGASPPSEVYDEVAKLAGISEQEKERTNESDGALTYRNCIQWARQSLVYAGALLGSSDPGWKRGVWELSLIHI